MRWPIRELAPELLHTLRQGYSWRDFGRDALAGVVVGVVALPLSVAFAIASGVRPEQGIYTAIVAGFVISALGGSRVQIGGPTGAFVVIVAGIVAEHGYEGLAFATILAGVLLVVMALARLGAVIRFVPYPVVVGFTAAIGVIVGVGQLGDALGLRLEESPANVVERCRAYAQALETVDARACAVSLATVLLLQLWPRVSRRVPAPLVALLATTAVCHLASIDVETVGSRFGSVSAGLPTPRLPDLDWSRATELVSPALSIALLGAIESLLSALVADGQIGARHRADAELFGQGVANILCPFFGGIPATGAIARTATNVRNGGRTPIAGIVHAATLLAILVAAGEWAARIPLATLAGILLVVAYNMSEWRLVARLLRGPRGDALVLATTFVLTISVDLTVAIQAGVVLAALLFARRMAAVTNVRAVRSVLDYEAEDSSPEDPTELPPEIRVFEVNGAFCFGAAHKFAETLLANETPPRVVILRMRHVLAIDTTGMQALEDVVARLRAHGAELLMSGVRSQPREEMRRNGTLSRIGEARLHDTFAEALARARELAPSRSAPPSD